MKNNYDNNRNIEQLKALRLKFTLIYKTNYKEDPKLCQ